MEQVAGEVTDIHFLERFVILEGSVQTILHTLTYSVLTTQNNDLDIPPYDLDLFKELSQPDHI